MPRRWCVGSPAGLGPDDAVITELPCDGPLRYYLMVNGLPIDVLYDYRIAAARRLFVVVNRPNGQTLVSVLGANKLPYLAGKPPFLHVDFGRSALYGIDVR